MHAFSLLHPTAAPIDHGMQDYLHGCQGRQACAFRGLEAAVRVKAGHDATLAARPETMHLFSCLLLARTMQLHVWTKYIQVVCS